MNTRPPKAKLRRQMPTDKITITRHEAQRIVVARRMLARSDYFLNLLDEAMAARPRWRKVYVLAVIDAGLEHLQQAIAAIDPVARILEKA